MRAADRADDVPNHLGWASYLTGEVEYVDAPGDHQTLHRSPNVRSLGGQLVEAFGRHT